MRISAEHVPLSIVLALGITQIVGYGTLYYSFGILAPEMAHDFGWTADEVFAVYSASLLAGGVIAPIIGRWMDRYGASRIMTIGSAAAAATLVLCAYSASSPGYAGAILLLAVASGMVQYQAAFTALVEIGPRSASLSITYLTLIAGFSSTLFWPITTGLHAAYGWRTIYLGYAVLNLLICLPLHYWIMRQGRTSGVGVDRAAAAAVVGIIALDRSRLSFYLATAGFALEGFALSAMLVHMVPMLTDIGLRENAVLVGAIFGPSQVLSRFVNMLFGRNLPPPALAILSAIFIVGGITILFISGAWLPGAVAFAVLLGLGSGLNSIAQGSLPLWLFGSDGYGAVTGRMASARLVLSACAPFAFAKLSEAMGTANALAATVLLGLTSVIAFEVVRRQAKRAQAGGQ